MKLPLVLWLERRDRPSRRTRLISLAGAGVLAVILSAVLIRMADASVLLSFSSLLKGALGGRRQILETLVQATPYIFTGLAMTVAFRGKAWNVGAEGQLYAGAMGATWASMMVAGLPKGAAVLIVLVCSFVAGAVWGGLAGYLKVRFGVSEIIVTVLMNFIILYGISYLLSGPWRDPGSFYQQSALIPDVANLPRLLPRTRLHAGLIIALVLAVGVYLLLWKTPFGYEIRAVGSNPRAAGFKGIDCARVFMMIMMISGGLAGLGGGSELAGIQFRLRLELSSGYGYTGIMIALLAGLNPLWAVAVAIFFGALVNGSTAMQIAANVPVAVVYAIQAIFLITVLVSEGLSMYRLRISRHAK
jgi:simple sugar transport system permease protein